MKYRINYTKITGVQYYWILIVLKVKGKHVYHRYFFIKDKVDNELINIEWCYTK